MDSLFGGKKKRKESSSSSSSSTNYYTPPPFVQEELPYDILPPMNYASRLLISQPINLISRDNRASTSSSSTGSSSIGGGGGGVGTGERLSSVIEKGNSDAGSRSSSRIGPTSTSTISSSELGHRRTISPDRQSMRSVASSSSRGTTVRISNASSVDSMKPLPVSPPSLRRETSSGSSSADQTSWHVGWNADETAAYQPMTATSPPTSRTSSLLYPDSHSRLLSPSLSGQSQQRHSTMSNISIARRPSTLYSTNGSIIQTPSPYSKTFDFPRPASPTSVDVLFEDLIAKGGYSAKVTADMLILDADRKWVLVYNNQHKEWTDARKKLGPTATGPMAGGSGHANGIGGAESGTGKNEPPEWYIGRFVDGTITLKNVESLTVTLRTYDINWVYSFIALGGQLVLAKALEKINKVDSQKRAQDPHAGTLEAEILKAIKTLFSSEAGANDAINNNVSIAAIVASLTSPQLPTRKIALELLIFLNNRNAVGASLVLKGLDEVQRARGAISRFEIWFRYFEQALDGRGRMGSVVGASDAVKSLRGATTRDSVRSQVNGMIENSQMGILDSSLSEYATTNMYLISCIISEARGLTVRVHLRAQMEVSGLRRILDKLAVFDYVNLRNTISDFIAYAGADDAEVAEDFKEDVLMNFSDPKGVYDAIVVNTEGRALDFFTSAMKHLLLVPKEYEMRLRYFQLIDTLVTSVVTDRKGLDGDFSSLLGSSVAAIASRFGDADRLQEAIEEASDAKAIVARMQREREALEAEMSLKDQGLVGKLTVRNGDLERALKVSREANEASNSTADETVRVYQEKVVQQDLKIRLLAATLMDAKGTEWIEKNTDGLLGKHELMELERTKDERRKTARTLEGTPKLSVSAVAMDTPARLVRKEQDESLKRNIEARLTAESTLLASSSAYNQRLAQQERSTTPESDRRRSTLSPDLDKTPRRSSSRSPTRSARVSLSPSPSNLPRSPTLTDEIRSVVVRIHAQGASSDDDFEELNSRAISPGLTTSSSSDTISTTTSVSESEYTLAPTIPSDLAVRFRLDTITPSTPFSDSVFSAPSARGFSSPETSPPVRTARLPSLDHVSSSPNRVRSPPVKITSLPISSYPPPPPAPPPPPYIPGLPPIDATTTSRVPPPAPPAPPAPPFPAASIPARTTASISPPGAMQLSLHDLMKGRGGLKSAKDRPSPSGASGPRPSLSGPPPPPPPAPTAPNGSMGGFSGPLSKTLLDQTTQKLRQFQWDKLPPAAVAATVWTTTRVDELEWSLILRSQGVFDDVESQFRDKETVKLLNKRQKKEFTSVLNQAKRQKIGITLLKPSSAEVGPRIAAIIEKILAYDDSLSETFLSELSQSLPDAVEEGKLNVYKSASSEDLDNLAEADRFLVECLKIYRLRPRIDGMLYRARFDESFETLQKNAETIQAGAASLLNAPHFGELLKLILTLGNYMNTGHKGGAFGFKIASINKLVDTKSSLSSDQTLLHLLARAVTMSMPETQGFLTELAPPADAYRADLAQVRAAMNDLIRQQELLSAELDNYFVKPATTNPADKFMDKMFSWSRDSQEKLATLKDTLRVATALYEKALKFYAEDSRSIASTTEFFAIFKTFVTSYQAAQADNSRQAAKAELLAARKAASLVAIAAVPETKELVDDTLAQLRASAASPRARRVKRGAAGSRRNDNDSPMTSLKLLSDLNDDSTLEGGAGGGGGGGEVADIGSAAKSLLEMMHGSGFEMKSPTTPAPRRRTRDSRRIGSADFDESPTASIAEESEPIVDR